MNDQTQTPSTTPAGAASRAEGANLTAVLEAGGSVWTRSLVEEVIGCLWLIAAVLAFGFEFDTVGWLLAIKAATDQGSAIWFAIKEAIAEKKASNAVCTPNGVQPGPMPTYPITPVPKRGRESEF